MFEIGNSLREARLRQGLEFADVERATKIRPKYLRALEDEQFEILPAQTYVKGFLSTYAEFLGLDGQLYVDEFNSRYVTREEEMPFRPRRSSAGRSRSRRVESTIVLAALVGIAIVFGLVIAAWNSGEGGQTTTQLGGGPVREPAEAELIVQAVRGTTRLAVHEESARGKLRYGGTLENGRRVRLKLSKPLWMWVQRPAAVELVVAGRRTTAAGRFLVVDADGVRRAAPPN